MKKYIGYTQSTPPLNSHCDGCGVKLDFYTRGDLKGLCHQCCKHLGGGKHSARAVIAEAKAMAKGGAK